MTPLTTSDLVFSEQANHNFSKTLGELKKHALSVRNRLQSILEDAAFVQRISAAYDRPVIANERCGSWYIDPNSKDGSAYFKSTDGHTGAWSFSTRRLNIHLLEAIGKRDGCVIVDSTRRGKRMPDALSKTVPIWCAVLNRALFPDIIESHQLHTPPQVVSSSEHAQIAARLEDFLQSFLGLAIDCATLRARITKPLRPLWVTPESYMSTAETIFEDYHPIICCTASRRVLGGEVSEGGYIQGSGDDTENWAFGLTPPVFWANTQLLLSTPESDLPSMISNLIASSSASLLSLPPPAHVPVRIHPTSTLYITDLTMAAARPANKHNLLITLHPEPLLPPSSSSSPSTASAHHLPLHLGSHKLGSRALRTALPTITSFIHTYLSSTPEEPCSITLASTPSTDHAVGAALAILCLFYDDEGRQVQQLQQQQQQKQQDQQQGVPCSSSSSDGTEGAGQEQTPEKALVGNSGGIGIKIDKAYIRRRLAWIVTAMPEANPSGATLQSVNGFLMPRR